MILDELIRMFNNREIAIAAWSLILLAWLITKPGTRKSLKSFIEEFFHYKILIPYLLAVSYTFLGVYFFSKFNAWTISQLKDTITWCIFAIISTMLNLNKVRDEKNYFKDALKENFKLSVVIEFIIGIYTFSLPIEFILVPSVVLTAGLKVISKNQSKYAQVENFFSILLILFGFITVGYTIYEISTHIRQFASYGTLRDFILSPMLALWFLPFIYLMSLYMTYESYFITMQFRIKDRRLLSIAKWQALIRFNTDTKGFERWKNQLFIGKVSSKKDIIDSIEKIKRLQKTEKNPPKVDSELGWSPYIAKDFLLNKGISTRFYMNTYESEWSASSNYTKLDDDFNANTVNYYVQGTETMARQLHLVLDVKNVKKENEAIKKFLELADTLYFAATKHKLPESISKATLKTKNVELKIGKITLIVEKHGWVNQSNYSLLFYVDHE